ncbi:MAG TPA: phosphocholine cytidylyltransferase family protein [Polyangiales bacterium]|nr:phosphocholine cytidylyltransferase family protein [Polyangiales bacterium]
MTRAIILAAGRGSRMAELTAHEPKCFVRLHGKRLLDWQLAALRGAELQQIALVRGYRAACFDEPITYFDNPSWQHSNMVRTLLAADAWLRADACIVSYSDIVYGAQTVSRLVQTDAELAIVYDPAWLQLWSRRFADPLDDAETFRLDRAGRLAEIGARARTLAEIEGQYVGLLKFTPSGWSRVRRLLDALSESEVDRLDMTSMLRLGLQHGWQIAVSPVCGAWGEVDAQRDLELYDKLIPAHTLER